MSLRENQADARQEEKQMSKHTLLEIKDLHVNVEDKEILDGVTFPSEVMRRMC